MVPNFCVIGYHMEVPYSSHARKLSPILYYFICIITQVEHTIQLKKLSVRVVFAVLSPTTNQYDVSILKVLTYHLGDPRVLQVGNLR